MAAQWDEDKKTGRDLGTKKDGRKLLEVMTKGTGAGGA